MGVNPHEEPEVLSADADPEPETGDHPDEVTDDEAEQGHAVYMAVDDLDDDSNGIDE